MTTPTLLDAARAVMADVDTTLALYSASEAEGGIFSALRAAIDREAERQEIIEGIVLAARRAALQEHQYTDYKHGRECRYCGRQRCADADLTAALARYDAMKEDDRA